MLTWRAACSIFAIGVFVGVLGDACHVVSGTTAYEPSAWPVIGWSPLWQVLLVATGLVSVAWIGARAGLPKRRRTRVEVGLAVAAGLALYAYTATLRAYPPLVGVVLMAALAFLSWRLWDASWACAAIAAGCAVVATMAEIALVAHGIYHYAADSNALFGVAPWLPCLFFALGAIASGLARPLSASYVAE